MELLSERSTLSDLHDHEWKTEYDMELGIEIDRCIICDLKRSSDMLDIYHRVRDQVPDHEE